MKKILYLSLACLFLVGCGRDPDNRQLSESIVRLQNEVDLAHEWIRELRKENNKLKFAMRVQKVTQELEFIYLNELIEQRRAKEPECWLRFEEGGFDMFLGHSILIDCGWSSIVVGGTGLNTKE